MFRDAGRARLLEADPELGAELDESQRALARARLVVPTQQMEAGIWEPEADLHAEPGRLGVLVLEGTLTRDVKIAETTCAELVGRGDLLRPWEDLGAGAPVPSQVEWHVLQPTRMALLDRPLMAEAGRYPEVISALLTRGVLRAQTLAIALAISCINGLKLRLLALLWHLADRFGRVGPEGVSVPLPLTHQIVARLAGATRPSVSTALKELENEGRISKRPGGGFLLHGEPPELARVLSDRREAARRVREARTGS